ncbi:hypothetical protein CEXT_780761 [Caerostris extrusa]|uniref:Uncharacterized protein n=1 Tax=Caerostris extrusa TaxID=172846 RepID=A0AAV4XFA2_CAEEX|nr:hypothetical protein CEXT_780761 [Caerostris extrusa]
MPMCTTRLFLQESLVKRADGKCILPRQCTVPLKFSVLQMSNTTNVRPLAKILVNISTTQELDVLADCLDAFAKQA